jgi:alkanesulfonate monooxygenase SsuD/methylene tetrahydromethanopterin reductase-like flavin-dependent oxidoreductase (luciferase family)
VLVGAPSRRYRDLPRRCAGSRRWSRTTSWTDEKYGWDPTFLQADRLRKERKGARLQDTLVGAAHGEFVTDEIVDRFCVLGTPAEATEKLRELEAVGVDQFNIYLMTHGQEETLEAYGREIIPQFAGVTS